MATDLSKYNNDWYNPGAGAFKRVLWYVTNAVFFKSAFPISSIKCVILRMYGASIGKGVVIKPFVNIKYPWNLSVADFVWIGEEVWIDNLTQVTIESNVCISQGAMLLCGNHNYKKETFDLMVGKITLKNGAWIGAKAVVCPGVTANENSLLTVGSIATTSLQAGMIYQGNPATAIKERIIK